MTVLRQIHGDAFDALSRMPSSWAHGCIADPPYGWDFMGRAWDRQHRRRAFDAVARSIGWLMAAERRERKMPPLADFERYTLWSVAWLREVWRVLVPGALALIFQGSKTYDLTAFAARLAGFEVLPKIEGFTGQAMAQGGNVGKLVDREAGASALRQVVGPHPWKAQGGRHGGRAYAADEWTRTQQQEKPDITAPATPLAHAFNGHGTRIRDQLLPIAVLMKPVDGSFARNAARWGVAGFDVDGARIAVGENGRDFRIPGNRDGRPVYSGKGGASKAVGLTSLGRFPGNVLLDSAAAEEVGEMSGEVGGNWSATRNALDGAARRSSHRGDGSDRSGRRHMDTGTAARYFRRFRYVARAPTSERLRGLESWHWIGDPQHPEGWRRLTTAEAIEVARDDSRHLMTGSNHPTLKSLELTRWASRLILPPPAEPARSIRVETTGSPGRLLVPFSGVLSEAIGAALAGWWEIVAVELSDSYVAQGAERWRAWGPYSPARAEKIERAGGMPKDEEHPQQVELF